MLFVNSQLSIDETEFEFRSTTAQGPGGQHVNRSQTRVILNWNVGASPSLNAEQRAKILEKLATRINLEGVLRVSSQKHRSQGRNRDAAIARLVELLAGALYEDAPRRATRPSKASKRRRVDDKKKRAGVKQLRKKPRGGEE